MEDLATVHIREAPNFGLHDTGIGLPPQCARWPAQDILHFTHATMVGVTDGDCTRYFVAPRSVRKLSLSVLMKTLFTMLACEY